MSYFVIDFKLRSDQKVFLKLNTLPTLLDNLWQSMASVAMFEYRLKSKVYLSYLEKIYDAIYGNPE